MLDPICLPYGMTQVTSSVEAGLRGGTAVVTDAAAGEAPASVAALGRYVDRYEKVSARWRIAERRVES